MLKGSSILLFLIPVLFIKCSNESRPYSTSSAGKITSKPSHMSSKASLVNIGSADEQIWRWIEFVGFYANDKYSYGHIPGFKSCSTTSPEKIDTNYYESMELRFSITKIDINDSKIIGAASNIMLTNDSGDSLSLFPALENSTEYFGTENGVNLKSVPAIRLNDNEHLFNGFIKCALLSGNNRKYFLVTSTGREILYKLCDSCKTVSFKISFINRDNGRIFLLEKNCYLDIVEKSDLEALRDEY